MNPIVMMMQMLSSGGNPDAIMRQIVSQNPVLSPALQLCQGKSPAQLESTFYNLCRSKGIDPQSIASQYGISLPQK